MEWLQRLAAEVAADRPCVLVTVIAAPVDRSGLVGRKWLLGPGPGGALAGGLGEVEWEDLARSLVQSRLERGRPGAVDLAVTGGKVRLYIEPYLPPPVLVVVGAGHVAQPLAQLGKMVGYQVVVIDDRPAFANRERFPTADTVICDDFLPALRRLDLGRQHHIVLVTRGHQHDQACLQEIIRKPLGYIGMIGSRTRVAAVFERLRQDGIPETELARVCSPIGLDIGAETPAEIAVAVIGELIMLRRGGAGGPLSGTRRTVVHGSRRVRLKE